MFWCHGKGGGTVLTYVGTDVNARVTFPDGTPVGPEFIAQLLGGPNTVPPSLVPLLPLTKFRSGPASELGYVVPLANPVVIPGASGGVKATIAMRAYNGE